MAEIRQLTAPDVPIGRRLADLRQSRARLTARIAELHQTLHRLDDFETTHQTELTDPDSTCWVADPRCA